MRACPFRLPSLPLSTRYSQKQHCIKLDLPDSSHTPILAGREAHSCQAKRGELAGQARRDVDGSGLFERRSASCRLYGSSSTLSLRDESLFEGGKSPKANVARLRRGRPIRKSPAGSFPSTTHPDCPDLRHSLQSPVKNLLHLTASRTRRTTRRQPSAGPAECATNRDEVEWVRPPRRLLEGQEYGSWWGVLGGGLGREATDAARRGGNSRCRWRGQRTGRELRRRRAGG